TGNSGTNPSVNFLGTTDNVALEVRVHNQRVLRLEPTPNGGISPNVIGGSPSNQVFGVEGATISGGGGGNFVAGSFGTIGGGLDNQVQSNGSTIGGGQQNSVAGSLGTIGGGYNNHAGGIFATVGGGQFNQAVGAASFAAGQGARALHDG